MEKTVVVLSGGMDSVTLLYKVVRESFDPTYVKAISFNYGQRHSKELEMAKATCAKLGVEHKIIDLTNLKELLSGSALTDNIEVPEGHYADENMKATVVPNRNSIMANIAIGWAVALGYDRVALGVHAGDHAIYPDCRPIFIKALAVLSEVANYKPIEIYTPFLYFSKGDIVNVGLVWDVDYSLSWTCYNPKSNAIQYKPKLNKFSLDWLIGFLEGEGCFYDKKSKAGTNGNVVDHYYPAFSITQNDKEILDDIKDALGFGSVSIQREIDGKATIYSYSMSGGNNARKLALLFDGKLRMKKKQEQFKQWIKKHNLLDFRNAKACGKCGSCVERKEAFAVNGVEDPLEYLI